MPGGVTDPNKSLLDKAGTSDAVGDGSTEAAIKKRQKKKEAKKKAKDLKNKMKNGPCKTCILKLDGFAKALPRDIPKD